MLVHRHEAAVFRFLRSLGATDADAEDALQECFLAAWSHAGGFSGGGSARAWLFSIARNALLKQRRTRVGEPDRFEALEALGLRAGWGTEPDGTLLSLALRDCLERAFERLSPDERAVLLLRDLEGFSGGETAEMLGLGLAAMKSRLHRARLGVLAELRSLEGCTDA